ncbi:MAG: PAS domain-containing protein [Caldilineaceae bacterium]|nr:PAS domain-containing protein [Caldilineaceae bacterium]
MQAEFYQSIVEQIPAGVIVFQRHAQADPTSFCFHYANQASEETLGISLQSSINQPLRDTFSHSLATLLPALAQALAQPDTTQDLGTHEWQGDGITGYFHIQVTALAAHTVLVMLQNVTQQKRTEEEHKQAELALEIYTRKLEASNRELEEFAYVASHDLQEPLRKIMTFGDRLRNKYSATLDEVGQDYLARMQSAAARMQALISDLLNLSRVSTRGHPLERVELTEVVSEILKDLEASMEQQNGTVVIAALPTVTADPVQMRQLFQNLIGNALKFHAPDRAPLVKVASQPPADPASNYAMCTITVEDNGIGFAEKYLDRIFQPFQRLHGVQSYEGTGMGLAICRRIVERHGGNITAKSQPGVGTTFLVSLPAVQPLAEEAA